MGSSRLAVGRIGLLMLFVPVLAAAASAQTATPDRNARQLAEDAFHSKQTAIRQRGASALARERVRSKAHLCEKIEHGGNAAIGECLVRESKAAEQDYLAYSRSIGALLRLQYPDGQLPTPPDPSQVLQFDAAEKSWRVYCVQSCISMSEQWDHSQASVANADCRLKLTWNHMNELADLYADLWH